MKGEATDGDFTVSFGSTDEQTELPACSRSEDVECVEVDGDALTVRVTGDGTLTLAQSGTEVARIGTKGGAADRRIDFVIRR